MKDNIQDLRGQLRSIAEQLGRAAQELVQTTREVTPEAIGLASLSSRILGLTDTLTSIARQMPKDEPRR